MMLKISNAVLSSVFSALKSVYDIIPHPPQGNSVDTAISCIIVGSGKHIFSGPIKKKEPVTPYMIFCICSLVTQMDSNRKDLRSALLFVG